MSEERTTLEIISPTVEEAVAKGLADLGLPEEAVEIEILDSGSRGIFGLGSRQARIRLTIKQAKEAVSGRGSSISSQATEHSSNEEEDIIDSPTFPEPVEAKPIITPEVVSDEDFGLQVARETVTDLLEKMKVHARVTTRYGEVEDPKDEPPIMVEIHGNDLSILIGRKSETLNALQYIAGLILGKELGKWVPVQVDVEGYRARRERMLRQLARRMADQAISTGRRQVLEPMPANERRVIHMELHDHPDVMTESIGDEPNRKVTISVKSRP
jgi:spoIIIJ-associated protein